MPIWWIDEPNILGSRNPTDAELEKIYQEGFRTIISLLNETEQLPHYDVKKAETIGFKRYSIPEGKGSNLRLALVKKLSVPCTGQVSV